MTRGYVRYVSFDVNSVCRRSKQNIPSFFLMPAVQSALCPQTGWQAGCLRTLLTLNAIAKYPRQVGGASLSRRCVMMV